MIINKFILHVLDKNSDIAVLNGVENSISPETDAFYQKVIRRILRDDDLRKASFENYEENEVRKLCDNIIYDESLFITSSQGIASLMFDSIKINAELDSCDLAIVLFTHKDQKCVAIIKLDYKKLYTHEIGYDEENNMVMVKMVTNDIGIQDSQKIIHAGIIGVSGVNDEWHLQVLDKVAEKEGSDSSFVSEFLNAKKVKDEKYMTKSFRNTTDNWITNAFADDIKSAEGLRSFLNYTLKEENDIDIDKFIEESKLDDHKKESFKELMEEKDLNGEFVVDKTWVEKKLKRRAIKTNTGFDIKGLLEDFEDPSKYSIKQNEDGSVNITIKNIEFYEEK
ncbi:nucleoid-associated protein [Peptostreptococcus equinus]|uniref:Nucleoid-associated protein n=1 Tax=Peptostreptococcus equinus TaxID=3003601 RepID=A0ABY7JQK7_9FIRM|nr:nucleoid-associated protein [Peptostreptococcus sp. CBA3647]WAW14328.1 nucleoid-associated protein [Peptostreptococcus sp. CBA3647]